MRPLRWRTIPSATRGNTKRVDWMREREQENTRCKQTLSSADQGDRISEEKRTKNEFSSLSRRKLWYDAMSTKRWFCLWVYAIKLFNIWRLMRRIDTLPCTSDL